MKEKIILKEISIWREEKLIDESLYSKLVSRYSSGGWDFSAIVKWTLVLGGITLGIGILTFITALIKSAAFTSVLLGVLACCVYGAGFFLRRERAKYYYPRTGNALIVAASFLLCGDVFAVGHLFSITDGNWPMLLLVTAALYFAVAYYFSHELVLIMALVTFAAWVLTETGYIAAWDPLFYGFNYPARCVLIGVVITGAALFHRRRQIFFKHVYFVLGILFLNIGLWLLSIFGNYGDLGLWSKAGHLEFLLFTLCWLAVDACLFLVGTKLHNRQFVLFAVVFTLLNVYTRYFEYFWNTTHKALFFIILGGVTLGAGFFVERKIKKQNV